MRSPIRFLSALLLLSAVSCGGDRFKGTDIDVEALRQALKNSDAEARVNACIKLAEGKANAAPAIPDLCNLIEHDKNSHVREMAVYAIYEMGPDAGKPAMETVKKRFGKDRSPNVNNVLLNVWNLIEPETAPDFGGKRGNLPISR